MSTSEIIMIFLTAIIALFTFLVWRVYRRIEHLTGAMESHSTLMMQISAKQQGIQLLWWDPTIEPAPVKHEHGKEIELKTIYTYLPLNERKTQPTRWERFKRAFK